jgi:hypothetical protein
LLGSLSTRNTYENEVPARPWYSALNAYPLEIHPLYGCRAHATLSKGQTACLLETEKLRPTLDGEATVVRVWKL